MDETSEEQFKKDVKINPSQLDIEAISQAELFYSWSEQLVSAEWDSDRAEEELDRVKSAVAMECRESPSKFGLSKTTEPAIEAVICTNQEVITATQKVHKTKRVMNSLKAKVRSLQQKKEMLEFLGKLHGQQYFAGPNVPRNLVDAWKKHQDQQEEELIDRQRKLTRRVRRNEV